MTTSTATPICFSSSRRIAEPRSSDVLPRIGQHAEARFGALRVLEPLVLIAIGQSEAGENFLRALDRVTVAQHVRREPLLVPGRHRTPDRHAGAEVDGVRVGLAIDGVRDRVPELLARDPVAPRVLRPIRIAQVEEEQIGIGADAEFDQAQLVLVDERPERREVLGADLLLQHVDLPRLQPHELGILIGNDLEDHLIEVRQLDAGNVLVVVALVTTEHQPLPGRVQRQLEGPDRDELGRRRIGAHRLGERPRLERRLVLVFWRQGHVVEDRDAGTERARKLHDHGLRVGRADLQRLILDLERAGQDAARPSGRRSPRTRRRRRLR